MANEMIVVEKLVPADIFKTGGMDIVLEEISKKAKAHVPDLTTAKGRKAIASNAAKVASSKTLLDKMGKQKMLEAIAKGLVPCVRIQY